ncbi:MAG: DNA polymerase Y family protein, partial [Candidatus Sericytochromatia bacterium]|nr:DNA polymerase Y family protein [Candidatus Sericytochromatia bacterium]
MTSRLACVDVPALPLQLLLRHHPDWHGLPVAVVDADKPQGLIGWVNGKARDAGVLPGMRYGAALALARDLRAAPVGAAAIAAGVEELTVQLRLWSPGVEPCADEPGVFWVDASGLQVVFPSLDAWADDIRAALALLPYRAAVVVGFSRFGSYALAKALHGRRATVLADHAREDALVQRVPLSLIGLPTKTRDALQQLGVRHVGDFRRLPAAGILRRFGPEAHRLHRFASGDLYQPLQPSLPTEPIRLELALDYREEDLTRLAFVIKQLVDQLLARLAQQGEALHELIVTLGLDDGTSRETAIRPAEPTLVSPPLIELVRLRMEALKLTQPVISVTVLAHGLPATQEQLQLFAEAPRRDRAAANRAFARLRATFGDDCVVRAVPQDRHLPEASFGWEPLAKLPAAQPRTVAQGPLIRRILAKPVLLPPNPRHDP